jgi:hypothetical protein
MVLRQWEVLDTRPDPSSVYVVEVVSKGRKYTIQQHTKAQAQTNRLTQYVDAKESLDTTTYTDRELCESMALAYVLGLEEHGCMVADCILK